jgi:hypothetical protein
MGLGLAGSVRLGGESGAERAPGRGHHAHAVVRRVRARQRPAQGKVFAWSTGAESGNRWARRGDGAHRGRRSTVRRRKRLWAAAFNGGGGAPVTGGDGGVVL